MSDLPRELPLRERDAALQPGADALDDIRSQIAAHLESTQGAWVKLPWARRSWPFVIAVVVSLGWAGYLSFSGGAVGAAAALATVAALGAFTAVLRAPIAPAWAERAARLALALGALALAAEIGLAYFAPANDHGNLMCARSIVVGGLAPAFFLAWYLRASQAPARLFHVVAVAGAAFLMSAAAVWAECPGTRMDHILVAHSGVPLVVAVVVVLALRPMLKGRPVSRAAAGSAR